MKKQQFKRKKKVSVHSTLPATGMIARFKFIGEEILHSPMWSGSSLFDEKYEGHPDRVFVDNMTTHYNSKLRNKGHEDTDKNMFIALAKSNDVFVRVVEKSGKKGVMMSRGYLMDLVSRLTASKKELFSNPVDGCGHERYGHCSSGMLMVLDLIEYLGEVKSDIVEMSFCMADFTGLESGGRYGSEATIRNDWDFLVLSKRYERNSWKSLVYKNYVDDYTVEVLKKWETIPNYHKTEMRIKTDTVMKEFARVRQGVLG